MATKLNVVSEKYNDKDILQVEEDLATTQQVEEIAQQEIAKLNDLVVEVYLELGSNDRISFVSSLSKEEVEFDTPNDEINLFIKHNMILLHLQLDSGELYNVKEEYGYLELDFYEEGGIDTFSFRTFDETSISSAHIVLYYNGTSKELLDY